MARERDGKMNIYVGNLSYKMSEDELKAAFEPYGKVDSARIVMDRESGRSRGFGFVEMPENNEALAAIEALNGKEVGGRTVTVNESRPKAPREGRGGFGGGRDRGPRNGGEHNRY